MARVTAYFPPDAIYTPPQQDARPGGAWPSIDEMYASGHRVLLTSGIDYGAVMHPLIFMKCAPPVKCCSPGSTCHASSGGGTC